MQNKSDYTGISASIKDVQPGIYLKTTNLVIAIAV